MSMFGSQVSYCTLRFLFFFGVHIKVVTIFIALVIGVCQVLAYQKSGIKLGTFKSVNESLTRIAIYISLLTLYTLGGSKVKAVSIYSS